MTTIASLQLLDEFVVVGCATGAVAIFTLAGARVGSLGASPTPTWRLSQTTAPHVASVPPADAALLAPPVRVSTSVVSLVRDVSDMASGGTSAFAPPIQASLLYGAGPPGGGGSGGGGGGVVVSTAHLLDNKGVVKLGGGGATYHGEVPGVGEVWTRSNLDVSSGNRVITHVVTVSRVDPQQDVLMGYSGLFPTRKDAVRDLGAGEPPVVAFSFAEFIEVRVHRDTASKCGGAEEGG